MKLTVHISDTIRQMAEDAPPMAVVEKAAPATIRQVAVEIGIPPILIVFASVDGVRKGLDDVIGDDAEIHLFGTIAGG